MDLFSALPPVRVCHVCWYRLLPRLCVIVLLHVAGFFVGASTAVASCGDYLHQVPETNGVPGDLQHSGRLTYDITSWTSLPWQGQRPCDGPGCRQSAPVNDSLAASPSGSSQNHSIEFDSEGVAFPEDTTGYRLSFSRSDRMPPSATIDIFKPPI